MVSPKTDKPCVHYWFIDENLVGKCRHCGATCDFAEIQQRDKGWLYIFGFSNRPIHGLDKPIGVTASQILYAHYSNGTRAELE